MPRLTTANGSSLLVKHICLGTEVCVTQWSSAKGIRGVRDLRLHRGTSGVIIENNRQSNGQKKNKAILLHKHHYAIYSLL